MVEVIPLEMFCWVFGWLPMVQVVVSAIIHHISQQTASEQCGCGRRSCEERDQVPERETQNCCCSRRKHKPERVHGVLMVAPVKKVMCGVPPVGLGLDVEQEAVQSVFDQRPNKYPKQSHHSYVLNGMTHQNRFHEQAADNRQPYSWHSPPLRASQELQDIISEKAWTLLADDRLVNPFLVPFLKMTNLENKGLVEINCELLDNHLPQSALHERVPHHIPYHIQQVSKQRQIQKRYSLQRRREKLVGGDEQNQLTMTVVGTGESRAELASFRPRQQTRTTSEGTMITAFPRLPTTASP